MDLGTTGMLDGHNVVSARLPIATGMLLLAVGAAAVMDLFFYPQRWPEVLGFGVVWIALGIGGARGAHAAGYSVRRAALCTAAILVSFGGYAALVGGSGELCVVTMTLVMTGAALVLPWGLVNQGIVCAGALAGYLWALGGGARLDLPWPYGLLSLGAIAALTMLGAGIIERYHFTDARLVAALREREARLASVFDQALLGMAIVAPGRPWLEGNDELCRILGRTRDQLDGSTWTDLTHPDDLPEERLRFERVVAGVDDGYTMDKRFLRPDGSDVHATVSVRGIRGADGGVRYLAVLVQDRSAHRRAEADREAALAAAERAREAAVAADASKGAFLATMSHKLLTPLNVILGMVDIAADGATGPELQECLRRTRVAAGRLVVLVNNALDFSSLEAGEIEIARQPFAPRPWLARTLESLRGLADERRLNLRWEIDDGVPTTVIGDAERLARVLTNLVATAAEAGGGGDLQVHVSMAPDGVAPVLRFRIADDAGGDPSGRQSVLFASRAEPASLGSGPAISGAGLGLVVCSRLVERMGGSIWTQTGPEQASSFLFTTAVELPNEDALTLPA